MPRRLVSMLATVHDPMADIANDAALREAYLSV